MKESTDAACLLEHAGVTMCFEKTSARNAPYLNGLGLVCPYKVSFSRTDRLVEVVALISNDHVPPNPDQVLAALANTLEDLEGAESFEQWCTTLAAKQPDSYDAALIQSAEAGDQDYLVKRYRYLETLKNDLQSIFAQEHYTFLCEFLYRHVMNDWPW